MKVLGLNLLKGKLYYAVLEGTKSNPNLIQKDRVITLDPDKIPNLMNWYETELIQIIQQTSPDKISYRLSLNPTKDQILTSMFPLGIINLLAFRSSIPIKDYTPTSFVASKLNLPKDSDLYKHCDIIFGNNPPYWDKYAKDAILSAWFEL